MRVSQFMHEMSTTSGVFGRDNVQVTFSGDKPFVEGNKINLPALPADHKLTYDEITALRGYVDSNAGRIRHTDRALENKFRASIHEKPEFAGLDGIYQAVEWGRVQKEVTEEYVGSWKNLSHMTDIVSSINARELKEKQVDTSKVSLDSVSLGLRPFDKQLGNEAFKELYSEDMRKLLDKFADETSKCTSTEDSIRLAKAIWKLIKDNSEEEEEDQQVPDSSDFDPADGDSVDTGDPLPGAEQAVAKEGQGEESQGKALMSGDDDPDQDGPSGIGTCMGDFQGDKWIRSDFSKDSEYIRGKSGGRHSGLQSLVDNPDTEDYYKIKQKVGPVVNVMKSKLRNALITKQKRDWDFGKESGRLDSKRLVAAVQRVPTVYKQRHERDELDTVVTVLVDLSGSMGGSPIQLAAQTAVALSECFEGCKIPFRVAGFTYRSSYERTDSAHSYSVLDTLVFKSFDEPVRKARGSLGSIPSAAGGGNQDVDAIIHELGRIRNRPESRKILLVLSDGYPAFGGNVSMDEVEKHMKKIMKEAERDGIECIGIGIESDAVKDYYDKSVVVDKIEDLSGSVFRQFTSLLV